jgi:hypothetical protein
MIGQFPNDPRFRSEKSVKTRQEKKAVKMALAEFATAHGIDLDAALVAKPAKRPNISGGSQDTDWRCPYCRRFNSIKRHLCAKCDRNPGNGRLTRAARRTTHRSGI